MAERKRIVFKSSKKSSISKVEIITVASNDVASLTARHPVGIVVAEKRNPLEILHSEQKSRPVLISGCPLPQVLPPEYEAATDIASKREKSKKNSKAKIFRPRKYVNQKSLRNPPKAMTFSTDHNVEADRPYNPQNYVTPSQDFESIRQSHTLHSGDENFINADENRSDAILLSGPPHYVVVSQGMRNKADPGFAHNVCNFSVDKFPLPCNSENSSMPSGSEELNSSEGKGAAINSGKKFHLKNVSECYNKPSSIARASEMSTSDTICDEDTISSETSYDSASKKESTPNSLSSVPLLSEVPQIIPVKRGSLHIRQIPHGIRKTSQDLDSKIVRYRGTARSMHYGKINKMINIKESDMENQEITYRGDSRSGIHHGASGIASSSASNIRKATRGGPEHPRTTRQQSLSWCPRRPRRLQPNLSATRGRQNGKPLRQAQNLKSSMEPVCSLPKKSTSQSPPPGSPSVVPQSSQGSPSTSSSVSSLESLTSPRAPLNASVLDLHRPVSISPPTTLSSIEPCNPLFDPPKGYVEAIMPQPRLEGSDGMPRESMAQVSEPDGEIGMSMDELADIGKWVADTREELKGVGTLLGQPPSRLSSILQGLSTATFDEDKYIISRRVDQYINKILRNNVDEEGKCTPSGAPPVIHRPPAPEARPAAPEARPAAPEARPAAPEARPDTAAATSGLVNVPELIKPRNHPRILPTHPPPLFVHSLMGRGRSDPLEPLQNYGNKGEVPNIFTRVERTTRKKEKLRSNNSLGTCTLKSAQSIPVVSRKESEKVSKVPLVVAKTKGPMKDKLQISTQTSVDIPGENIAVSLPSISIMPGDPPKQSEKKHKIITVVHESILEEDQLSERIGNDHHDDIDESNKELEGKGSRVAENDNINEDVEGPSSYISPNVETSLPHLVASVQEMRTDDGSDQLHTDENSHRAKDMSNGKPDDTDFEYGKEKCVRKQGSIVGGGGVSDPGACRVNGVHDHDIGGGGWSHDEDELPGYLPEVKWEEVVVREYRCEDDENAKRMINEAENRLHQHELKLRIMQRLEEALRGAVQVEQTPVEQTSTIVPDAQVEVLPISDQDEYQALDVVMAARSILEGLVRERLDAAFSQIRDDKPKGPTDFSMGAPSLSSNSSTDKSRSSSDVKTPLKSPSHSPKPSVSELVSDDIIRTPSPSPPPETISPRKMLTPELSHEDADYSEEVVTTPPSSPVPILTLLEHKYPQTPSATPESSPSKVKNTVTPKCTPEDSLDSENVVQQLDTPTQSPTAQQVPHEVIEITRIPTPSETSRPYLKVPEPDSAAMFTSCQNLKVNFPRGHDQSTQVCIPDTRSKHREDEDSHLAPEEVRSLVSPDTPSVICQSSADITVSSSVEATDVTCYTVSEGEVLNCSTSVNVSMEAGEVTSSGYLQLLTCGSARTTAYNTKTTPLPNEICEEYSSQNLRSEGELELDENGERLLIMEDHQPGTDEHLTSRESRVEELQEDQGTSDDGLQVSVVHDESYSSGDAITLSTEELSRLQQENAELLLRLSNLGSFSFLTRNFQSSH